MAVKLKCRNTPRYSVMLDYWGATEAFSIKQIEPIAMTILMGGPRTMGSLLPRAVPQGCSIHGFTGCYLVCKRT